MKIAKPNVYLHLVPVREFHNSEASSLSSFGRGIHACMSTDSLSSIYEEVSVSLIKTFNVLPHPFTPSTPLSPSSLFPMLPPHGPRPLAVPWWNKVTLKMRVHADPEEIRGSGRNEKRRIKHGRRDCAAIEIFRTWEVLGLLMAWDRDSGGCSLMSGGEKKRRKRDNKEGGLR